ncbi:MAG: serine--tRNA ligase, partial [Nanoarchaeota archaeon]
MIDIKLIRENPELVKQNNKNRKYDIDVSQILKLDNDWKKIKFESDN